MGPIKIKIATTQIEGASEYDAPKASSEYDAPKSTVSEYDSPKAVAPKESTVATNSSTVEAASCYSYEGEECIYTEPASGVKYRSGSCSCSCSYFFTQVGQRG